MSKAAVIIGASGGIGQALAHALDEEGEFTRVWRFSRTGKGDDQLDLTDETSIITAAKQVAEGPRIGLIVVATGILHEGEAGSERGWPEKSYRALDAEWLARIYEINTIGPALIAKHFLPLLPKDEVSIFAALSARVGSISGNVLGGWHGYRASKAALNMLIKNFALEMARTHKRAIIVGLHPGTVDTALSKPFQGNVASGKLFAADRAAVQLLDVLDALRPVDSGKIFAWDGEEIEP